LSSEKLHFEYKESLFTSILHMVMPSVVREGSRLGESAAASHPGAISRASPQKRCVF